MTAAVTVEVLNNTYLPLGRAKLKRALALVLNGEAVVDKEDRTRPLRSVDGLVRYMPLVIRLLRYVKVDIIYAEEAFSREGVLRRDNHTCAYCGITAASGLLMTHDHIFPQSRGGKDEWMNAVTACTKCNNKKKDRTPEEADMPLLFQPSIPRHYYIRTDKPQKVKTKKPRAKVKSR